VESAAVSFLLPEEGPGGAFAGGLHTDVAVTDAAGRAILHGLQWNRTAGRFGIRIVASREQARAGMVSFQYIAETPATAARAPAASSAAPLAPASAPTARSKVKWVVMAALAAGGAVAAGLLAGKSSASNTAVALSAPVAAPVLAIGNPTVAVGKP